MMFKHDERPLLKMTIDVMTILFALVAVMAGKNKEAEVAAVSKVEIVTQERDGAHAYAHGLEGQLEDAETDAANFAKDGEEKAGIIATLEAQVGEQGEQIGELATALASLRPGGPVDAVFLIDCTASTDRYHDHLKSCLKALFRWAPRVSSELRIGVIPFRDRPLAEYPMRLIQPRYKDGGKSQDQLLAFIDGLTTETAPTHHLPVFRKAFKTLSGSRSHDRRAVAILVGDIGPSELDNVAGFSAKERHEAARIVDAGNQWVSGGMRTVAAIYLGAGQSGSEDRRWFEQLSVSDSEHFAADSSEMFNVILKSIER